MNAKSEHWHAVQNLMIGLVKGVCQFGHRVKIQAGNVLTLTLRKGVTLESREVIQVEYTIRKLAQMAGVSTRTLRYYDEIGLLKPVRVSSSGYRIYGREEVDRLQQILFYRELDLSLESIADVLDDPKFDRARALRQHRDRLIDRRERLDLLIESVDRTIAMDEGRMEMNDERKFEGFKREMIEENERKYGSEIRSKYGNEAVDRSNAKVMGMTQGEHDEAMKLFDEVKESLALAKATGDPAGELAQKTAELHKRWLMFYWSEYNPQAHAGLARMYVEDDRFRANYDSEEPGSAEFLRDAILIFTGEME